MSIKNSSAVTIIDSILKHADIKEEPIDYDDGKFSLTSLEINLKPNIDNKSEIALNETENKCILENKYSLPEFSQVKLKECTTCKKSFAQNTDLKRHILQCHNQSLMCNLCNKHYSSEKRFLKHKLSHKDGLDLKCSFCSREYSSFIARKRHERRQHLPRDLPLCHQCGKCFPNGKFEAHLRVHLGIKPFVCIICTKAFTRKEFLVEHQRIHTGEKPYGCSYCGRRFTQKTPLTVHERSHTGEKPYICKLCGKGYASKGIMDAHMKHCNIV